MLYYYNINNTASINNSEVIKKIKLYYALYPHLFNINIIKIHVIKYILKFYKI